MNEAIKVVITDEALAKSSASSCGIRCLKCPYPEGYIELGLDDLEYELESTDASSQITKITEDGVDSNCSDYKLRCNRNQDHRLTCQEALNEKFVPSKMLTMRRYALVVSP